MVVACLALFVATAGSATAALIITSNSQIGPNTIYGANKPASANDNIVNGSIANGDIKANGIAGNRITDGSLTGTDLANNTLTGTQINESKLGTVPNASQLGGNAPGAFFHYQHTAHAVTSNCATAAETWSECAPVTLTVPSGHFWYVTVISTVTADPGNANVQPLFCPSTDGPSCLTGNPERTSYQPNTYSNWSSTATGGFGGGTYRFNTGMKWPFALPSISDAYTSTTVIAYDYRQENVTG